jgi:hypothetical protein
MGWTARSRLIEGLSESEGERSRVDVAPTGDFSCCANIMVKGGVSNENA